MTRASPLIRDALGGDIDGILRIERASFPDPWSPSVFRQLVQEGSPAGARVMVACMDEQVVGFAVAERADPEIHVTNIAVDPQLRRAGIARCLMDSIVSWSEDENLEEIWLEVREGNRAARALYRGLGFVEVVRRKRYYRHPEEDALVLALWLHEGRALHRPTEAVSLAPCS